MRPGRSLAVLALGVFLVLPLPGDSNAFAGEISRVRLEEKDGQIVIKYNLSRAKTGYRRNYDLRLAATFVDSTARAVTPRAVVGDIGRGLDPASGREITWNILDDLHHYDVHGDLEVRVDATINRWALRKFRRTRVGFEFVTDLFFEADIEHRNSDLQTPNEKVELNHTDFSLVNNGLRGFVSYVFPNGQMAEVGLGYGAHRSAVSGADTGLSIPEARWSVLDGRVQISGMWIGLGIGKYNFGDAFGDLPRNGSAPKYWYYEFSLGGRWRFGRGGSFLAELRHGRQILGDLEDGGDVLARVRAVRVGYSVDLMDIWSIFGTDEWERLPPEEVSEIGRIENVQVRRELRVPEIAGLSFVYVPSGIYFVGTPGDEELRDPRAESTPFTVYADGFYISTTEVTQEAYRAYAENQWTSYEGAALPAHSVTYGEATAFCGRLAEADRNFEWSLPSEVEWEVACRGGLHPEAGPIASPDAKERARIAKSRDAAEFALMKYGWFRANRTTSGPQPVQGKRPNVTGLYDVHGNVAEWCRRGPPFRWEADQPGRQPIRGGSITSDYARCRAGARALEPADSRKASIGFRVVCRPKR